MHTISMQIDVHWNMHASESSVEICLDYVYRGYS